MAVLVREHVRLRERPALGAEARLELVEEAEVDVDLLVGGAVERPDLRARVAAARLHRVRVEDRLRGRVAAHGAVPVGLDAVDVGDDPAVLPLVRVRHRSGSPGPSVDGAPVETDCPSRLPSPPAPLPPAEHDVEDEDDEADDAEPAAAGEDGPAHAAAATHVGDLGWVELGAASEPHRDPSYPGTGTLMPGMARVNRLRRAVSLAAAMAAAAISIAQPADAPAARARRRCAGADDARARRPAAHGRDEGHATVARAPRPDPPRRDRRSHPLRLQHREPGPAAGADGRAPERRPGGGPAAAPDLDRPGGRTGAAPPLGRAGRERDRARRVERSAHPAVRRSSPAARCGRPGSTVDLAPVADVPGPGSFMAADDRTFGASGAVVGRAATAFARGLADARVAAAAKHFPGIGRATRNTDSSLVEIGASRSALDTRSGAVSRRDRRRRADRHDLERVVSGARLEAGSLVAADPVPAAQRARIQGRHDHRRARRGSRNAAAVVAIRRGALGPGRRRHPALHGERGVERGGLSSALSRPPPRDASRPRRCAAATTGSSRSSAPTAEWAVVLERRRSLRSGHFFRRLT